MENPVLTDAQVRRMYQYAKVFIRSKWAKWMDWILDDLCQDFAEAVIRSVITLKAEAEEAGLTWDSVEQTRAFEKALRYGRFHIIDMLRGKGYYFSYSKKEAPKGRYYQHERFSQMDPDTWQEFHAIHSHCPEPGYRDSILTQQLLSMMDPKARKAWELRIEGWTEEETAEEVAKTGKRVGRSMISKRLSRGVRAARKGIL